MPSKTAHCPGCSCPLTLEPQRCEDCGAALMVVDGALAREPAKPFVSCLSPEGRARAKAHNRFMRGIDR